jgi:hypothetical protein
MSMSDSNRNKNVSRWDELAEQLGLPEEQRTAPAAREEAPAPAPEPTPTPATAHEDTEVSFALTPRSKQRDDDEPRFEPQDTSAEPLFEPASVQVEAFAETVIIQSESTADVIDSEDTEEAPADAQGASSRSAGRRRRRRRSSGKNKRGANGEAPAAGEDAAPSAEGTDTEAESLNFTAPPEAPSEPAREESKEERGERRGRNRGRGRRRREEEAEIAEPASEDEDEVQESGGAVGFEEDGDDEEVANYANWTVPSWKDLIASLYRPER